jgi:hypothetical protein
LFTFEPEFNNKKLNFLDLTLERKQYSISPSVYRQPTTTDTMIHNNSCHPYEHKLAGINFIMNRIMKYPMSQQKTNEEIAIGQQLLNANGYNYIDIKEEINKKKCNNSKSIQYEKKELTIKEKRSTFTYVGKDILPITKLLNKFQVKTAFKTNNTLAKHLIYTKKTSKPQNQIFMKNMVFTN